MKFEKSIYLAVVLSLSLPATLARAGGNDPGSSQNTSDQNVKKGLKEVAGYSAYEGGNALGMATSLNAASDAVNDYGLNSHYLKWSYGDFVENGPVKVGEKGSLFALDLYPHEGTVKLAVEQDADTLHPKVMSYKSYDLSKVPLKEVDQEYAKMSRGLGEGEVVSALYHGPDSAALLEHASYMRKVGGIFGLAATLPLADYLSGGKISSEISKAYNGSIQRIKSAVATYEFFKEATSPQAQAGSTK